ncbi:hypothetical protein A2272_04005 [Candidatus Peregrinibacteria bacterium RIFOXYA12_FULL_33_12]|nr:MAG: hypothetical protein A2263_03765 [Candidatus Peregrinibacteria bacterium RIFOXYA2_FULL_33_21]OGJ46598.1 MAG: hypothetical protein A2272_04005 [Candidatus Peregrinibacteria bacterium RIFOXYA12_FULL_33_12]OGJ51476.1 MAG: hypothetical protein A2307_00200 [Candidatus Peregrinibacteria bacterium RIFOXYB2_FULL_33_20]
MTKFKNDNICNQEVAALAPFNIQVAASEGALNRRVIIGDTILCQCNGTSRDAISCLVQARNLADMHEEDKKLRATNAPTRQAASDPITWSIDCASAALVRLNQKGK